MAKIVDNNCPVRIEYTTEARTGFLGEVGTQRFAFIRQWDPDTNVADIRVENLDGDYLLNPAFTRIDDVPQSGVPSAGCWQGA